MTIETMIAVFLAFLLGVASSRLSNLRPMWGTGGGRVPYRLRMIPVEGDDLIGIYSLMTISEQDAVLLVDKKRKAAKKLEAQGKPRTAIQQALPTEEELQHAAVAWESAAHRYFLANPERARELGVTITPS